MNTGTLSWWIRRKRTKGLMESNSGIMFTHNLRITTKPQSWLNNSQNWRSKILAKSSRWSILGMWVSESQAESLMMQLKCSNKKLKNSCCQVSSSCQSPVRICRECLAVTKLFRLAGRTRTRTPLRRQANIWICKVKTASKVSWRKTHTRRPRPPGLILPWVQAPNKVIKSKPRSQAMLALIQTCSLSMQLLLCAM